MQGFAAALIALLSLAGVAILVLILHWIGVRASKQRPLKPYFLRLGRIAPSDVCPCPQGRSSELTYHECCRPKDVEKLDRDLKEYLWRRWAKRSYGGRRRMKTLSQRLEEFPVPEVTYPEWVVHPEHHAFPISDTLLRAWSPDRGLEPAPSEHLPGDSTIDDIF